LKTFAGRKKDEPVILELEAIQELLKQAEQKKNKRLTPYRRPSQLK
jgi:hypothetical protein